MIFNNRAIFILIYGLFLGFVLSFLYAGPILNYVNLKISSDLLLLIIFMSGILSCIFTYHHNINITPKILSISIIVNISFSILLYLLCQFANNNIACMTSYISAGLVGFSAMFTSNSLLSISKNNNKFNEIFINMGLVMLIANAISYSVYILLSFKLKNTAFFLALLSVVITIPLCFKVNYKQVKNNLNVIFYKGNIFSFAMLIFLIKISEGIIYKIVEHEFAIHQTNYEYTYIIPYVLALFVAIIFLYKTKRHLFSLLSLCISLIGIGMLFILFSEKGIFISNFFMHFGLGLLDIIIWGGLVYLIHVYDNGYKISSFIMFFHMLGVFMGGFISEFYLYERELIYFVAIVSIFLSFMITAKVCSITNDVENKKKQLDQDKEKKAKLKSKEKYKLLTKREQQVVSLILLGKINRVIAQELNISETTVKTHCKNIYVKLGIKSKKEVKLIFNDN